MKVAEQLKKYDKYLRVKKLLDGTISITRKSPFAKEVEFNVCNIRNQYIGSGRSIMSKISLMDNQRSDIVDLDGTRRNNIKKDKDSNRNMHKDVAELMLQDSVVI